MYWILKFPLKHGCYTTIEKNDYSYITEWSLPIPLEMGPDKDITPQVALTMTMTNTVKAGYQLFWWLFLWDYNNVNGVTYLKKVVFWGHNCIKYPNGWALFWIDPPGLGQSMISRHNPHLSILNAFQSQNWMMGKLTPEPPKKKLDGVQTMVFPVFRFSQRNQSIDSGGSLHWICAFHEPGTQTWRWWTRWPLVDSKLVHNVGHPNVMFVAL